MSDYETFWADREKQGQDEPQEYHEEPVTETFEVNGETVAVTIHGDWVTFEYANGTKETVPQSELYFCPKCLGRGEMPFCEGDGLCKLHEHPLIKFDPREYENFRIVSQMDGGKLVPQ